MSKKEVKNKCHSVCMDRAKRSRNTYEEYECVILQTVSRPQTNLDMTTNWSIRHL